MSTKGQNNKMRYHHQISRRVSSPSLAFKGTVQQDVIFTVGGTGTVLFIHLFVIAKLKK